MKVIARVSHEKVLCEVSLNEIEKFLGMYYRNSPDNLFDVGNEINLGRGYDYHSEIRQAFSDTQKFINSNARTIKAITDGLSVLQIPEGDE